ncbi:MAG TPA: GntR family transcriptional regulator [Candidatus Angelobacter sp.]|nr:GntR family transcriptional regulator [Candidatus Angelobacter sp.]
MYTQLKSEILRGVIPLGERLREAHIAKRLETSRTPVREAIRRLEAEGLVSFSAFRGAIVREFTYKDVEDSYNLRAEIEGYATALAAMNHTSDDLETFEKAISLCKDAFNEMKVNKTTDAVEVLVQANQLFHSTIIKSANNNLLNDILKPLVSLPIIFSGYSWFSLEDILLTIQQHEWIYQAIKQKDPNYARTLMMTHIYHGRNCVLENFHHIEHSMEN